MKKSVFIVLLAGMLCVADENVFAGIRNQPSGSQVRRVEAPIRRQLHLNRASTESAKRSQLTLEAPFRRRVSSSRGAHKWVQKRYQSERQGERKFQLEKVFKSAKILRVKSTWGNHAEGDHYDIFDVDRASGDVRLVSRSTERDPITHVTEEGLVLVNEIVNGHNIPRTEPGKNINVATFNIREFGLKARRSNSIHYLAAMLRPFDLVAVVETRENLDDLDRLLAVLGNEEWGWHANDPQILDRAGNKERMLYLYRKDALRPPNITGDVEWMRTRGKDGNYRASGTHWRSPMTAQWVAEDTRSSGGPKTLLGTVSMHIRYGKNANVRVKPARAIADWVKATLKSAQGKTHFIALGDANTPKWTHPAGKALASGGLAFPEVLKGLTGLATNLRRNKQYDVMLSTQGLIATDGGVLTFPDLSKLYPGLSEAKATRQMSDHYPLWATFLLPGH